MYTKKDFVLLLYNLCERDRSTGRNNIFSEPFLGAKRTNLLANMDNNDDLPAIASENDLAFSLQNYNIWSLESSEYLSVFSGIGHGQYIKNIRLILDYIHFRI